jgi:hypothetical protein
MSTTSQPVEELSTKELSVEPNPFTNVQTKSTSNFNPKRFIKTLWIAFSIFIVEVCVAWGLYTGVILLHSLFSSLTARSFEIIVIILATSAAFLAVHFITSAKE